MTTAAERLKQAGPQIAKLAAHIRAVAGDDEEAFVDTLDGETDAVEAARAVVREIAEADVFIEALRKLAESYGWRKARLEAKRDRLRAALGNFLADIGQRSLTLPEATLSLARGSRSLVGAADPETLPERFVRTSKTIDRAAVKAALEAGESVSGFSLDNAPDRLSIRGR